MGVFILWFCWFGFNGCSTVSADGDEALIAMGTIFTTTNLAAAIATLSTMIITWLRYGKPDVSMTLNGSLAGLVAITAGCDVVDPFGAFCIGLVASFVVVFGIEFVEKVLKVDDPVGAVGVHGMCGAIGTVLTGLFSTTEGLFYGHGVRFLGIQILGVVCVIVWVAVMMTIIFQVINHTIGLRVSATEEISGLDLPEHGLVSAYADFYTTGSRMISSNEVAVTVDSDQVVSPEVAIPVTRVEDVSSAGGATKMTQIRIITKENHFEVLKEAMNRIGITGMTVNHVLGCGMQKGSTELYRGTPLEINLLPKVQVDIVVCKVPVETVIKEAKRVLYTGHIGDGKIFVYNVENVIKVRTGEEGYDALQDK
nr:P-II family nitrogen regulator [Cellulosilyticum ruminicola]